VNNKSKNIILYTTATLIAVGLLYTIFRVSTKNFLAKTPFRRRSVRIAKKELERWNKRKETSSETLPYLQEYWRTLGWKDDQWTTGTAWSGAFISFVMKKARATKEDFPFSARHSVYIQKAIDNKQNKKRKGFKGYKLDEKKVELGDLVCYARQGGVGYDTKGEYISHCDIVVAIDGDNALAIGGNVSNSVTESKIPLVNGFVKAGNRRFVVIKTK
jgi:hypothetical protein